VFEKSLAVILIAFLPPLIPPYKGGKPENPVPSPIHTGRELAVATQERHYELRITNYELRITNYELRITNYELREAVLARCYVAICGTDTFTSIFLLKERPVSPLSMIIVSPEIKVFSSNLVARGFSTSR
jgi:hypothetical protein